MTTTAAPSVECKLSVDVGDKQTDGQTWSVLNLNHPFHYFAGDTS